MATRFLKNPRLVHSVNGKRGEVIVTATDVDVDAALTANSDVLVASQKATKAYADTKVAGALDTDVALAANSDAKVASQKATKAYADTKTTACG